MFWNTFYELCRKNNTYPLTVVKETGIATGSITKWKNGTVPSGATLQKLADYFAVPVDYLLGRGNKRTRRLSQFHYLKAQSTMTTVILQRSLLTLSIAKSNFTNFRILAQIAALLIVQDYNEVLCLKKTLSSCAMSITKEAAGDYSYYTWSEISEK